MKPISSNTLLMGLGGGSVAKELTRQHFKFDVVELDKRIPELAHTYFFLDKNHYNLIVDDARHYMNIAEKKYDLILIDIVAGEVQPSHIYSIEAMERLKSITTDSCLIIINYQGSDKDSKTGMGFRTLYKTLTASGLNTYYWSDMRDTEFNDIIFILSKKEIDFTKLNPNRLEKCCLLKEQTHRAIKTPFIKKVPKLDDVEVLTDNRPFLEHLNYKVMLNWRKSMLKEHVREKTGKEIGF